MVSQNNTMYESIPTIVDMWVAATLLIGIFSIRYNAIPARNP